MTPVELRTMISEGRFDQPTSGVCDGYVQANMVALPKAYADDFEAFCRKNPKPYPLLEKVGPGETRSRKLAPGADLLSCIPRYRVWEHGEMRAEVSSIEERYREDLVFFLLGCSFSFEEALISSGIPLRHVEQKRNVAMYNTSIPLEPAGPFKGEMVVSMRPLHRSHVARACMITGHYPEVHGEPVHVGYPEMIGIEDIGKVDYGDSVRVEEGEIPVFWACGVTPQNVLAASRPPFAITHAPGYMFVGDLRNSDFARCSLNPDD